MRFRQRQRGKPPRMNWKPFKPLAAMGCPLLIPRVNNVDSASFAPSRSFCLMTGACGDVRGRTIVSGGSLHCCKRSVDGGHEKRNRIAIAVLAFHFCSIVYL